MPTKPNENIVPDYKENVKLVETLDRFSSLVKETVNFGTHVFEWIFEKMHKGDHHLSVFVLFGRSLKLLDSISLLIKESCVSPCKIILRSLFETMLSLEYIIQENLEQRGRDYILCIKHKELKYLKKFKPDDPSHKDYISKFPKDNLLSKIPIPKHPDVDKEIESIKNFLNSEFYVSSEKSYQSINKQKGRIKWWFNLHEGPGDIIDLADKMKRPAQYEILYRNWADYAHGTGSFDDQIEIVSKDTIAIPQLRNPADAQFLTLMAVGYGLSVIRTVIEKYAEDKLVDFSKWYEKEIQKDYLRLSKGNIIEVK